MHLHVLFFTEKSLQCGVANNKSCFATRNIAMKQGALHREWSLWNQIVLGQAAPQDTTERKDVSGISAEGEKEGYEEDGAKEGYTEKAEGMYSPYVGERGQDAGEKGRLGAGPLALATKKKVMKFALLWIPVFVCIRYLLINDVFSFKPFEPCSMSKMQAVPLVDDEPVFSLHNVLDPLFGIEEVNATLPHEVIDIPLMPYSNVSSPVYSSKLLNHTFALSWNKPAKVQYTPPPSNITYNRIVLTLDTTVQGVQYDRLLHVYLADTEIWRSSTIEPAGKLSHSYSQKDVTLYSSLFKEEGNLLVQLDNLVTSKLTGAFNVTINALFFNDPEGSKEAKGHFGGSNNSYPTFVPLTPSTVGDHVPPIVYYPDSPLSNIKLPAVNFNTTKLALLVSTSGNAAEEFWFSNVVDQYKDYFLAHNRHFYGHGSCRVINVYVNGIRVHSTNPKPYVFSGGVSPTLWNPIVSTGSFDLVPYFVDLTPILPLLWESPSSVLDIEITNCIDDDEKTVVKSGIGSNWITSASLAVWEDETVDDSFGTLESIDNTTAIKSFAIAPPFSGILTQILKASYQNALLSNITYVYKDGTQATNVTSYESSANQTSLILITKFGDSQSDLSVLKSNLSVSQLDPLTFEPIKDFTMLTNNTLKNKLKFLPPVTSTEEDGVADTDISFTTNLTVKFNIGLYSGLDPMFEIKSKENGTANFTISSAGNHGTGTMLHNYTLSKADGSLYSRVALADNGTIVYDNITETVSSLQNEEETASTTIVSYFSKIAELDWLTQEEINEIGYFLNDQETTELVNLLDNCPISEV